MLQGSSIPHPSIVNGSLYGGDYDINKCNLVGKPLSEKCINFFFQEQCAYECDPNFGMCVIPLYWSLLICPNHSLCPVDFPKSALSFTHTTIMFITIFTIMFITIFTPLPTTRQVPPP